MLRDVIGALQATVERVEITELKEQTFYARIHLSVNGETYEIDARPSDSIALALKVKAKIFVNEALFNISEEQSQQSSTMPTDPESLRERLKKINPEDFGKYSL